MFQARVVEEIQTDILCWTFLSQKSHCLWNNVIKYCRAGQATGNNMAHAHCMLGTQGYRRTLRNVKCIAFPLQQWLHKHTSMLCYTFIACLVCPKINALVCPKMMMISTRLHSRNHCLLKVGRWVKWKPLKWGRESRSYCVQLYAQQVISVG